MPRYCSECGASSKYAGGETIEVHGLCIKCYNRELSNSIDYIEQEVVELVAQATRDVEFVENDNLQRLVKWERMSNS